MKWNIYCKCNKPTLENPMDLIERKEINMFSEINLTFECSKCKNKILIITELIKK